MRRKAIGDIRPSQVITQYGPGAVVDLQTLSVIVAGIDKWTIDEDHPIHEPRLEAALGVSRFFSAKPAEGKFGAKVGTIPTYIFPRAQYCPVCETISLISEGYVEYDARFKDFKCKAPHCRGKGKGKYRATTLPAPFIVACPSGHMDDFPWREYCHGGPTECKKRMKLVSMGKTVGVADYWLRCECGQQQFMINAFGDNRSEFLGPCTKRHPFLGPNAKDSTCANENEVRPLPRGSSNTWFPLVRSSLKVREIASPIGIALSKCPGHQVDKIDSVDKLKALIEMDMFPSLKPFDPDEIWQTIRKIRGEINTAEVDLRRPEWDAFRDVESASGGDLSEFFIEEGVVPDFVKDKVSRVILARKLVEVRALTGFTRVDYASFGYEETDISAEIAPIYSKKPDWLPAVETRGEGIFIELNEYAVREWEDQQAVRKRAGHMEQKFKEWEAERGQDKSKFPGARFVLLHSLAHVLIRQMSLDCGYSMASVRERIYSSRDPQHPMAGILIYTATPDSEGSLGGLVDLGSENRFPKLLREALEGATRCSSDPLCADHQPEVHASINGSACHACILVPETSCESFNRFLDRNMLVPTMAYNEFAFFISKVN